MYAQTSGSGMTITLENVESDNFSLGWLCGTHVWTVDSLRGSNRNQRVEHVRCLNCGKEKTRVWKQGMNQPRPDSEYSAEEES